MNRSRALRLDKIHAINWHWMLGPEAEVGGGGKGGMVQINKEVIMVTLTQHAIGDNTRTAANARQPGANREMTR